MRNFFLCLSKFLENRIRQIKFLSLHVIYSFNWFDNNFIFFRLNSTTGSSLGSILLGSPINISWEDIFATVKQDDKIFTGPTINSVQYVFIYNIPSALFSNFYSYASPNTLFTFIARPNLLYLLGSINRFLGIWNISKTGPQLSAHPDLTICSPCSMIH